MIWILSSSPINGEKFELVNIYFITGKYDPSTLAQPVRMKENNNSACKVTNINQINYQIFFQYFSRVNCGGDPRWVARSTPLIDAHQGTIRQSNLNKQ